MTTSIEQLENAIRQQAQSLANNYLQTAQQQVNKILSDANQRHHLQETRQTQKAQALADQYFQRRLQSSEIQLQAALDQMRWNLIQAILQQLNKHLQQITHQPQTYLPLLQQFLVSAVGYFKETKLIVEVTANDHNQLTSQWSQFCQVIPNTQCQLRISEHTITGGLIVHDQDNRLRINNSFEGLIDRLEEQLYQVMTTQLFATVTPIRSH